MSDDQLSPALIGAAIASIIFVVALIALFVLRRGGKRRRTLLVVGLSDAGKTLLYSRLITGDAVNTYTSMTENVCSDVIVDDDGRTPPITVVDIPGEDRVRRSTLDRWLNDSLCQIVGIVCVVDSVTFNKQSRDVAELVYDLLVARPRNCPLLIACNKQDSVQAKSANLIKVTLAKELTLLQKSRSASLEVTGGSKGRAGRLDTVAEEFDWYADAKKTTFVEVQCKQQAGDRGDAADDDQTSDDCVARVRSWIAQLK